MATVAHPRALPPMPAVARILSQFDRRQLASFIEVAISLIDQEDGDPDLECDFGEDEFFTVPKGRGARRLRDGPGCPISDPGGCEHNGLEPEHE